MNYKPRLLTTLALCSVLLASCSPPLKDVPSFIGKDQNACLPEAAAMAEGLKHEGVKAEVVVFQTTQRSHAIVAYIYPTGSNRLWAWDSYNKSSTIRAYFDDPLGIAKAFLFQTGTPSDTEELTGAYSL